MGMMQNILAFLIIETIGLALVGYGTPMTDFLTGKTNLQTALTGIFTLENILPAAAAAIIASYIGGGSLLPYVIFAPVAVILFSFVAFPTVLFNAAGWPPELAMLMLGVKTLFQFFLSLGVVNWFKTGSDG